MRALLKALRLDSKSSDKISWFDPGDSEDYSSVAGSYYSPLISSLGYDPYFFVNLAPFISIVGILGLCYAGYCLSLYLCKSKLDILTLKVCKKKLQDDSFEKPTALNFLVRFGYVFCLELSVVSLLSLAMGLQAGDVFFAFVLFAAILASLGLVGAMFSKGGPGF